MAVDKAYSDVPLDTSRDPNVGPAERGLSLVGGTLLTLYGLQRGGGNGILLALLGGSLIYRDATGYCYLYDALGINSTQSQRRLAAGPVSLAVPRPVAVHLETAMTINRPVEELYRYWRRQENLPCFMTAIDSVIALGDTRSHWVAKGPLDARLEWDSEITAEQPEERIAWRSLEGSDIDHQGEVRFQPAPGGRGTEVRLKLDIVPPGGILGKATRLPDHLIRFPPDQVVLFSM